MLMAKSNGKAKPETLADGTELARLILFTLFHVCKVGKAAFALTIQPHY